MVYDKSTAQRGYVRSPCFSELLKKADSFQLGSRYDLFRLGFNYIGSGNCPAKNIESVGVRERNLLQNFHTLRVDKIQADTGIGNRCSILVDNESVNSCLGK